MWQVIELARGVHNFSCEGKIMKEMKLESQRTFDLEGVDSFE